MATTNPTTGDALRSRAPSKSYDEGYDRIFGGKKKDSRDFLKEFSGLSGDKDRWEWVIDNKDKTNLCIAFADCCETEDVEPLGLIFSDILDENGEPVIVDFDSALPSYLCAIDLMNALGLQTTYD